jgi:hypothetical protein|uniref:Uncharacterized protein n=1 Tax=Mus musculus TaxID=10090 RepID=Q3V3M0_MOUSE|nr:unnamed protein product [Mus musculus]
MCGLLIVNVVFITGEAIIKFHYFISSKGWPGVYLCDLKLNLKSTCLALQNKTAKLHHSGTKVEKENE